MRDDRARCSQEQVSPSTQRSSTLIESKKAQLVVVLGACLPDDAVLHRKLLDNGFSVEATLNALLSEPPSQIQQPAVPEPMCMERDGSSSSENSATKRARSEELPSVTKSMATPFVTAAAGACSAETQSALPRDAVTASIVVTMQALTLQMQKLQEQLPAALAAAVPAAVRAYDETEAQRARQVSYLMPHTSCLMPHASCLMPHASCLMPPACNVPVSL